MVAYQRANLHKVLDTCAATRMETSLSYKCAGEVKGGGQGYLFTECRMAKKAPEVRKRPTQAHLLMATGKGATRLWGFAAYLCNY